MRSHHLSVLGSLVPAPRTAPPRCGRGSRLPIYSLDVFRGGRRAGVGAVSGGARQVLALL